MSDRRNIVIIHNPAAGAGRRRRLHRTIEALLTRRAKVTVLGTRSAGHATQLARDAALTKPDLIVAAGGDGTLNEVINGLMTTDLAIPLGLIPVGTANVMAHNVGLNFRPARLAEMLMQGPVRQVFAGHIESDDVDGRYFIAMAGAGFDGSVVAGIDRRIKKVNGKLAFALSGLRVFCRAATAPLSVQFGDTDFRTQWAIVTRGPYYAGRYALTPTAAPGDNRLQVVTLDGLGRGPLLLFLAALFSNMAPRLPIARRTVTGAVTLTGDCLLEADGEPMGHLPARITLSQKPISFVYPPVRHGQV